MGSFECRSDEFYCCVGHGLFFPGGRVRFVPVGLGGTERGRGGPHAPVTAASRRPDSVFIPSDFTPMWVLAVCACSLFQLFLLIKKPNWE